jgi:hypothetical protein
VGIRSHDLEAYQPSYFNYAKILPLNHVLIRQRCGIDSTLLAIGQKIPISQREEVAHPRLDPGWRLRALSITAPNFVYVELTTAQLELHLQYTCWNDIPSHGSNSIVPAICQPPYRTPTPDLSNFGTASIDPHYSAPTRII